MFSFDDVRQTDTFAIKKYKNGTAYKGQVNEQGNREGLGVQINSSGRVYEGSWLKDKRNGQDFETYKNGN